MQRDKGIVGVVLVTCSVMSGLCRVLAQPLPTLGQGAPQYSYYRIPLHNVSPDLMAWWIDPDHNAKPALIVESERVAETYFRETGHAGKDALGSQNTTQPPKDVAQRRRRGLFALPSTVDLMVPAPAQKALLIHTTPDGLEKVQQIVHYLDLPLRQVEVEAQFVAVNRADAKAFWVVGIDTDSGMTIGNKASHYVPQFNFGFLRGKYHPTLDTLIGQGKAEVIAQRHFSIINNISVSFTSQSRLTDVSFEAKSQTGKVVAAVGAPTPANSGQYFLATRYKLTVTPTVNNDDTVTVRMQPLVNSVLTNTEASGEMPVGENQFFDSTAVVHDGDTIVLESLSALGNGGTTPAADPNQQLMIFITPHIGQPLTNQAEDDATQAKTVRP